jgi:hypothetical protein
MDVRDCRGPFYILLFHLTTLCYVRFEVFTAVRMIMTLFWVLASCRLVGRCQRFGETYCLILSSTLKMETVCFSETLSSTDESTRRQNPEHHHQQFLNFIGCILSNGMITNDYKWSQMINLRRGRNKPCICLKWLRKYTKNSRDS